jgi:hypothetical protein
MEELEIRPNKVVFRWALLTSLVLILLTYVFYFADVEQNSYLNYLTYLPFFAGLIITVKQHRDNDLVGFITFGRAFSTGFRFSSLLSLFMGLFMIIYFKWLNPEVLEQGLIEAENQMLDQGQSSSDINKAMDMARSYGPYFAALGTSIMYTLIGGIASLVLAFVFKREKTIFITEEEL